MSSFLRRQEFSRIVRSITLERFLKLVLDSRLRGNDDVNVKVHTAAQLLCALLLSYSGFSTCRFAGATKSASFDWQMLEYGRYLE